MAAFKFAKNILLGNEIEVYSYGGLKRDFTYFFDIVDGIKKAINAELEYEIINLGGNRLVVPEYFISLLEKYLGKPAKRIYLPKPKAGVESAYSDITKAQKLLGWQPKIPIEIVLKRFCEWFLDNWKWIREILLPHQDVFLRGISNEE